MLQDPIAIEARHVSKTYRVYRNQARGWLGDVLLPDRLARRFWSENRALQDVSLTVRRGEVLGVIGRNGSGKSTFLKIIAGLSQPSSGSIAVSGHVRCLLGTGVGFNPRLTGRENLIFGSMAMGIERAVAEVRSEEMIAFAELEEHIDRPTMFYSSGMRTRLAVAVAFQEVPEIFMLDEALSAGDAYFVRKCDERIKEICSSGKTVIIVTHATGAIERLCSRAALFEGGRLVAEGEPESIVQRYEGDLKATDSDSGTDSDSISEATAGEPSLDLLDAFMCGDDGERRTEFEHAEPIELRLRFRTRQPIRDARFSLTLFAGHPPVAVTSVGTRYIDATTHDLSTVQLRDLDGSYELLMSWPRNPLGPGDYHWMASFWAPPQDHGQAETYLKASLLAPFRALPLASDPWVTRSAIIESPAKFAFRPCAASRQTKGSAGV